MAVCIITWLMALLGALNIIKGRRVFGMSISYLPFILVLRVVRLIILMVPYVAPLTVLPSSQKRYNPRV